MEKTTTENMTMEMTTTENMTTEKTATEERTVDMRMVPRGYQYCFQEKCPMRKSCLRWIAGQHVDPAVTWGPAVYPTARKEKECSFYQKAEMQVMAWGFNNLFMNVLKRHDSTLRRTISEYLGGNGTYYRYRNGKKLLSPEQQRWILKLFKKYGYTDVHFDHFVEVYDFEHF